MTTTAQATPAYTALREHAAWRDLSDRGRIRLTGEDRARLLHAMTTNHVQDLQPGQGQYTFFLNAQGRILADAHLLCFDDHMLLDTEPELRTKIYEHLDRYIIADDVTLEDVTDSIACVSVEGPEAAEILGRLGAALPETAYSWQSWGDRVVARIDTTGAGGFFVILPAAEKAGFLADLTSAGVPEVSAGEARTIRIENGKPRYGEEISERYLVQEAAQMQAIHFSKGCYLGQEIVERVRSRGQVHRMLRTLEIEGAEPPAEGTKLTKDGGPAAEVASAVYSPGLGKTVALAYVRTQFADPGTALDGNATVR